MPFQITRAQAACACFTFGTRLTNITRHLKTKDVDAALAAAGAEAQDWKARGSVNVSIASITTGHGQMGQGAVVLLITDGLDRDPQADLEHEMRRLHLSSRRLIWLNPLLRWDEFSAKATGIRTMLPHVDCFRASHSISSLEDLAEVISKPEDVGEKLRLLRTMDAT